MGFPERRAGNLVLIRTSKLVGWLPEALSARKQPGQRLQPRLAINELSQPLVLRVQLGDHVVPELQHILREEILLTLAAAITGGVCK